VISDHFIDKKLLAFASEHLVLGPRSQTPRNHIPWTGLLCPPDSALSKQDVERY